MNKKNTNNFLFLIIITVIACRHFFFTKSHDPCVVEELDEFLTNMYGIAELKYAFLSCLSMLNIFEFMTFPSHFSINNIH